MNGKLLKAINHKMTCIGNLEILRHRNWNKYRKQRYFVTKLKREPIKGMYFFERCHGGSKSTFLENNPTFSK